MAPNPPKGKSEYDINRHVNPKDIKRKVRNVSGGHSSAKRSPMNVSKTFGRPTRRADVFRLGTDNAHTASTSIKGEPVISSAATRGKKASDTAASALEKTGKAFRRDVSPKGKLKWTTGGIPTQTKNIPYPKNGGLQAALDARLPGKSTTGQGVKLSKTIAQQADEMLHLDKVAKGVKVASKVGRYLPALTIQGDARNMTNAIINHAPGMDNAKKGRDYYRKNGLAASLQTAFPDAARGARFVTGNVAKTVKGTALEKPTRAIANASAKAVEWGVSSDPVTSIKDGVKGAYAKLTLPMKGATTKSNQPVQLSPGDKKRMFSERAKAAAATRKKNNPSVGLGSANARVRVKRNNS